MKTNAWLILGGITGFLGVAFGAFGAHGIEEAIPGWYTADDLPEVKQSDESTAQRSDRLAQLHEKKLRTWMTGVRYHFYHAFAVLIIGVITLVTQRKNQLLNVSAIMFLVGIVGFSGSIYALVISKIKILGMTAAIGGTILLVAWFLFVLGVRNLQAEQDA